MTKILLSVAAEADLFDGFEFYERQLPGLGTYFLNSRYADIDLPQSLQR